MSALAAMQDKTAHLENSLSAETKIKMELFSALGEVKRQMEIQRRKLHQVCQMEGYVTCRYCAESYVKLGGIGCIKFK